MKLERTILALMVALPLVINGCSGKTEYSEVSIPTAGQVELDKSAQRPSAAKDTIYTFVHITDVTKDPKKYYGQNLEFFGVPTKTPSVGYESQVGFVFGLKENSAASIIPKDDFTENKGKWIICRRSWCISDYGLNAMGIVSIGEKTNLEIIVRGQLTKDCILDIKEVHGFGYHVRF